MQRIYLSAMVILKFHLDLQHFRTFRIWQLLGYRTKAKLCDVRRPKFQIHFNLKIMRVVGVGGVVGKWNLRDSQSGLYSPLTELPMDNLPCQQQKCVQDNCTEWINDKLAVPDLLHLIYLGND